MVGGPIYPSSYCCQHTLRSTFQRSRGIISKGWHLYILERPFPPPEVMGCAHPLYERAPLLTLFITLLGLWIIFHYYMPKSLPTSTASLTTASLPPPQPPSLRSLTGVTAFHPQRVPHLATFAVAPESPGSITLLSLRGKPHVVTHSTSRHGQSLYITTLSITLQSYHCQSLYSHAIVNHSTVIPLSIVVSS